MQRQFILLRTLRRSLKPRGYCETHPLVCRSISITTSANTQPLAAPEELSQARLRTICFRLGRHFTRHETGRCPRHNRRDDDNNKIMTALGASGALMAGRTWWGRGTARDRRRSHVRDLCVHTQSVHAILDGLKHLFQLNSYCSVKPNLVTHAHLSSQLRIPHPAVTLPMR